MIVIDSIVTISEYFSPLFEDSAEGEILLVTSKGVYCRLLDRIFMLSDASFGITPIGILIDKLGLLTAFECKEGQKIKLRDRALHLPGGIIRLKTNDTNTSAQYGSLPPERILECAKLLQSQCKPKGLSSLCAPLLGLDSEPVTYSNPLCQIAHPHLNALIQALSDRRPEDVNSAVNQLIGMGIGLTPSSDDVILGMLYTLLRIAPESEATRQLKDAVTRYAPVSTNAISAAYLLAVVDGAPFTRLDDVLLGLAGQIPLDIKPTLEIGSSSGSEMLLGLLIAAKIIYL